eukprot:scaffold5157_cov100-Cylindrotheca_fusiformis.AAC.5
MAGSWLSLISGQPHRPAIGRNDNRVGFPSLHLLWFITPILDNQEQECQTSKFELFFQYLQKY